MTCEIRQRKDDIPKYRGEKTWACDKCGGIMFSAEKPVCRLTMLAEMAARQAFAFADDIRRPDDDG